MVRHCLLYVWFNLSFYTNLERDAGGEKVIDVDKLGQFLAEKKVVCYVCKLGNFVIVEKEYALPKWLPSIAGLDATRTFLVAVVQCENCGYLSLFNALNYTVDDTKHEIDT